jgi:hypothetical protein
MIQKRLARFVPDFASNALHEQRPRWRRRQQRISLKQRLHYVLKPIVAAMLTRVFGGLIQFDATPIAMGRGTRIIVVLSARTCGERES